MAMDKILDKIKRGHFLVDEWCNIHSKDDILSLREELYAEAITMGMERLNCVIAHNSEVKTIGGGLTEQEQREQKNMLEILSRLDNWLFFDGSNNDLQRFIIALNKIGYRLNEAQLYLGRNYEEHIKQVVGLVSILENLNEDALYNQEDIKKECELNRTEFEKRIKPLLDKDIKELEESISLFRKVWFENVDNLGDQGYWTDEQRRDYKSWFSHLDYLFIARLKQFQKVFRKPFEMQKKELNELNEHYYKIVVDVVNTRLVKGDSSVCIDEICSLIERQLNESFTLDIEDYIDYVKEGLKDGKYLNIYGRGNPILEDGLPIALTELKHKLSKKESIKGKEETSTPIKKVNVITKANKKYFDRAVAKGYAEENNGAYIWKNKKVMLGYFVYKVYCQDVTDVIPYKAVGELFGVQRLDSTIYGLNSAKKEQKWKWKMDKEIFFD